MKEGYLDCSMILRPVNLQPIAHFVEHALVAGFKVLFEIQEDTGDTVAIVSSARQQATYEVVGGDVDLNSGRRIGTDGEP